MIQDEYNVDQRSCHVTMHTRCSFIPSLYLHKQSKRPRNVL